ncbi:hypothetical protein [Acinetobacter sp. HR7]|uniref:hypothetical protein n=1 Tax=Acinetobacter sp. HR7 TaxID=1509403 RepID=UPI00126A6D44|nr:hypothetical protein [Acinetobacter sp. HR7]
MNRLIKKYYQEFESYHTVWTFKNILFVCLFISVLIFFSSIIGFFYFTNAKNKALQDILTYCMLLAEVFALYLFYAVEKQRNEIVKQKFRHLYKNDQLTLLQIKKRWFREALAIPNHEYINLIEKIEKYYLIQSKYKGGKVNREKIYNRRFKSQVRHICS